MMKRLFRGAGSNKRQSKGKLLAAQRSSRGDVEEPRTDHETEIPVYLEETYEEAFGTDKSSFPTQDLNKVAAVSAPATAGAAANTDHATAAAAAAELTRDLVKKFIADIWNRGEISLIPDVCSPSLRFNGNTGFDRVGHEGLARMVATIRQALDEYHCEIHSMVVEQNKCFCRLRFTGKHVGPLLGYPPTGQVVAWMGATEFTVQQSKILKVWELGDVKSLEEQLSNSKSSSGSGSGSSSGKKANKH